MPEEKKTEFFIVTDDVLKKMWEGADKETDLLNSLCIRSTQVGKPVFGTEIKSFLKSLKDANNIHSEAVQTFLRFGKVDCILKNGEVEKLNN